MHPFFKPVWTNDNSTQSNQPSKTNNTSPVLSQNSSHEDIDYRVSSNHYGAEGTNTHRPELFEPSRKQDLENVRDLEFDLNMERRKRRKTTPFEESNTTSTLEGPTSIVGDGIEDRSLYMQLREAANTTPMEKPYLQETQEKSIDSSSAPSNHSPIKLTFRQSPTKTPRQSLVITDVPLATPPSSRSDTLRNESPYQVSPVQESSETRQQKVLKVTKKGKLVSSPPSVNSPLKRRTRGSNNEIGHGENTLPNSRKLTSLTYGKDQDSRTRIGVRIDEILSGIPKPKLKISSKLPQKLTHPFFIGNQSKNKKTAIVRLEDDSTSGCEASFDEKVRTEHMKPKDWNDLGFQKKKVNVWRAMETIEPPWPPRDTHNVIAPVSTTNLHGNSRASSLARSASKSKTESCSVADEEDVLRSFGADINRHPRQLREAFPLPQKVAFSPRELMDVMKENFSRNPDLVSPGSMLSAIYPGAFERMQSKLLSGMRSDELWLHSSAPTQMVEVLQTQSRVLRNWLASQQVHLAIKKTSTNSRPRTVRKRHRKRKGGELDDFIASDEEEDDKFSNLKNAIVITGPHGCGKTASVFAVAKELDFEVFEIYPGMRRSAKDIFEKVGDMTQNHLVQRATHLDREREATTGSPPTEATSRKIYLDKQKKMNSFLPNARQPSQPKESHQDGLGAAQSDFDQKSHSRKQSLILFEEVDILFEEDRGFWTGVIQLIELSKRPAVLTCNDLTSVPVEDLPLHAVLVYESIDVKVAVDYLLALAAAEGHYLTRGAIHSLYLAKGRDLRATISELNFWCQKSVGSEKCGLDWDWDMHKRQSKASNTNVNGDTLRLFSKDTYATGMGLVPRTLLTDWSLDRTALLRYLQNEFQMPLLYWDDKLNDTDNATGDPQTLGMSTINLLQQTMVNTEAKSILDLFDNSRFDDDSDQQISNYAQPGGIFLDLLHRHESNPSLSEITTAYLQYRSNEAQFGRDAIFAAFGPLMMEKPQFPVSTGRSAPSLDTSPSTVLTDIAPYVRAIVQHDQRLEAFSKTLQGNKARKTRASRAAQDGGSKATTRDEKWFPTGSDYDALLQTGGQWPMWPTEIPRAVFNGSNDGTESIEGSEATSPAADVDMITEA